MNNITFYIIKVNKMNENNKCIIIHYNEIALKGKNRGYFENILIKNIKSKVGKIITKIYRLDSRIIIEYSLKSIENELILKLKKIFGISNFGIGEKIERNEENIIYFLEENKKLFREKTAKVETKRTDKRYPLNSMELNRKIGEHLHEKMKVKIKMKNPDIIVNIEVLNNSFLIFLRKEKGLDGLPVGSSGRVLCLLSGGVDSAVASFLMMKRGCIIDFLHISPYPKEKVIDSKITKIIKKIGEYGNVGRLFLIPYKIFYKYTFERNPKYELVLFRRFMYSISNKICEKEHILGIVSGDSLGQVASQTLENLYSATAGLNTPIYRPLISFNKLETIKIAQEIGVYNDILEKYNDCCSLSAVKHPATRSKKEKIDEFANEVDLEKIIEEALNNIDEI